VFDLTGKVVLVTGGTSGIGLGMAEGLVDAGAHVVVWGRNPDKNARAVQELAARGGAGRVLAQQCDVGEEVEVEAAMAELLDAFGGLHGCFCNAGTSTPRRSILDTPLEDFRMVLRVNLEGTWTTAKAAARQMVAQGEGGSIVVTSSTATIMGQAGGTPYAASKGGQLSIAKALAVELARHGIRVNTLIPGWAESELTAPAFAWDKFADAVLPRIPQRRWGRGDDFAGIAVYLVSDASRYHTGDAIVIDGGYTLF
jgi:NAD(P)-dependent dehydrogenase (short-subunit alcohol dehydrogenase family)